MKIEFQFGHVGFEDKNWSSRGNVFLEQRKGEQAGVGEEKSVTPFFFITHLHLLISRVLYSVALTKFETSPPYLILNMVLI